MSKPMTQTCEYCKSPSATGPMKCPNCSAPLGGVPSHGPDSGSDYRHCPYCKRKLLALGSPACNYCGRRLPDRYIKARAGDLQRLCDLQGERAGPQLSADLDEASCHTKRIGRRAAPLADWFGLDDLTDLLK